MFVEKLMILIAFDVSGSMEKSFVQSPRIRSESLFLALTQIIKNSTKKQIISIGTTLFGCKKASTCDFIRFLSLLTITNFTTDRQVPSSIITDIENYNIKYSDRLAKLGSIFGAPNLIFYTKHFPEQYCKEIYKIVIKDIYLIQEIVFQLLKQTKVGSISNKGSKFMNDISNIAKKVKVKDVLNDKYHSAIENQVKNAFKLCLQYINQNNFISCDKYEWKDPIELQLVNGDELFKLIEKVKNTFGINAFMNWFEKYIYGMTPTSKAIEECFSTFRKFENTKFKVLFLITDGDNNIGQDPYDIIHQYLKEDELKKVIIVSCYYSSEFIINPRKLYYKKPRKMDKLCEKLFDVSSILPVDAPGFKILSEKYNWELPKEKVCIYFSKLIILM